MPAGFKPLLAMVVREHAFIRDYQARERGKHIATFFRNIDLRIGERPLQEAGALCLAS